MTDTNDCTNNPITHFSEAAADALEFLIDALPDKLRKRIANAMKRGCRLSISCGANATGQVEVAIDLWGDADDPIRLYTETGITPQRRTTALNA